MPELSPPVVSMNQAVDRRPSGRSRMGKCTGIQIAATGSYVPEQIVTNEDLVALGCDSEWIVQRTGIRERRRVAPGQSASDLAYEAAVRCLSNAGVSASDVDLVIVATITPDYFTPSTACLIQRRLGCVAPAMDINAACAGFMYALATAGNFVRNGMAQRALVIGSEVMSSTIDPSDIKTYPLFGDGAGAALVIPANDSISGLEPNENSSASATGLLSYTLGAEGCGGEMLCIPGGGSRQPLTADGIKAGQQYLHMDGRGVFKWAVRVVDDSCRDCLLHARVEPNEIDLVLLHQANIRIIDSAVDDLGIPRERVYVNLDRFGNTSAASIPLALDQANHEGRIQRGDKLLICGFGAGLAWGTAILRW